MPEEKRFATAQLDEIPPVPCPCGQARRAFKEPWNTLASVHLTDISVDSKLHYHKKMTEVYVVLEGEGYMELDGERIPLKPLTTVMIRPGCVHRAVGKLRIINFTQCTARFDPAGMSLKFDGFRSAKQRVEASSAFLTSLDSFATVGALWPKSPSKFRTIPSVRGSLDSIRDLP